MRPFLRDRDTRTSPPCPARTPRAEWALLPAAPPTMNNSPQPPPLAPHPILLPVCAVSCHDGALSLCLPSPGLCRTLTAKDDQTHGDKGHTSPLSHLCWPKGTRLTHQCPPSSHCYGDILPEVAMVRRAFTPRQGPLAQNPPAERPKEGGEQGPGSGGRANPASQESGRWWPQLSLSPSPWLLDLDLRGWWKPELPLRRSTWQDGIAPRLQRNAQQHPHPHPASPLPPTQERENQWPWVLGGLTLGQWRVTLRWAHSLKSPTAWRNSAPLLTRSATSFPPSKVGWKRRTSDPNSPGPGLPGAPSRCSSKTAVPQGPRS